MSVMKSIPVTNDTKFTQRSSAQRRQLVLNNYVVGHSLQRVGWLQQEAEPGEGALWEMRCVDCFLASADVGFPGLCGIFLQGPWLPHSVGTGSAGCPRASCSVVATLNTSRLHIMAGLQHFPTCTQNTVTPGKGLLVHPF